MSDSEKMKASAREAMIHVMGLKEEDKVLVVTDEPTRPVGEAFLSAAAGYGCSVEMALLPEEDRPLEAVPAALTDRLEGRNVVINMFKGLREETPFRVKWIQQIMASKSIRLGHGPNITEAMMTQGPMNVDYGAMRDAARKLMKSFEGAKSVRLTAPGGTDLTLDIEDRAFMTDVQITEQNPGNLPCGEIWCGPKETGADGVLVIDGSIGDVGNVSKPLRITLVHGRITGLECADDRLVEEIEKLIDVDEEARVIGELGIGLNPGAKLTGILLEDEKALRTAHIAFGNNEDMPGGCNRSKTHRDFLFYDPTFEVTFSDGSRRIVIQEGEFMV